MTSGNTELLIEKVELIAKYYYKGFGASIDGIVDTIDAYLIFDDKKKYSERTYKLLNPLSEFYDKIPFNDLNAEEFYPLNVVNRLLGKFKDRIDEYLVNPTNTSKAIIRKQGDSIIEVGRLYDDSLHSILNKIRTDRSFKDYRVKIIDDKNQVWKY